MKKIFLLIYLIPFFAFSQNTIDRVEPPFWWVGMNNTELQIMFYGKGIAHLKPHIDYEGISIETVFSMENDNYLFVYLNIDKNTEPGDLIIDFKNAESKIIQSRPYPILKRKKDAALIKGYDNSDVMCLITPDRFVNGSPQNDNIEGMVDKLNRADDHGRHGGDIRDIINNLDYFSDIRLYG